MGVFLPLDHTQPIARRSALLAAIALLLGSSGCPPDDTEPTDDDAGDDDTADDDSNDDDLSDDDGDWVQTSAGEWLSCGLHVDGSVECWGGASMWGTPPQGESFTKVSTGSYHACGLLDSGELRCWGLDDGGNLDVGQVSDTPSGTFLDISTDRHSNCAVRSDHAIVCWGELSGSPLQGEYESLTLGRRTLCGIHVDGTAECFGADDEGQLDVPPGEEFVEVSCGSYHTCGLRQDGTVVCWGCQGDATSGAECDPPDDTAFVHIFTGSFGISEGHDLRCWPEISHCNTYGRYFAQADYQYHFCGVTPGGAALCWGCDPKWEEGECDPP